MAALLSTSRRRRKDRSCHFCGASNQSDCHCGGWTRKDEKGNIIDYLPQMSDPSLNPKPPLAFSPRRTLTVSGKSDSPNRPTSSDLQSSSPCCSTCLANQNLQINLLANYLPGDLDSRSSQTQADPAASSRELLDNLASYKSSLEARYPVLCPSCSPKVAELIQDRNYRVKAFSLNESVKRLRQPLQSRINPSSFPRSSNNSETLLIHGIGGKIWMIQEWLWRIQGILWLFSYTFSISIACYAAFSIDCESVPSKPRPPLASLLLSSIPRYCCLELLYSFFDFTWSRVRKNLAQGIRTKVVGKRLFVCFNTIACLIRLPLWAYWHDKKFKEFVLTNICILSPSFGLYFFGSIGAVLLILLIGSLSILKTDSPIGGKSFASSKVRTWALATPKPTPALSEHELFSTLSLTPGIPSLPNIQVNSNSSPMIKPEFNSAYLPVEHEFGKSTSLEASLRTLRSSNTLIHSATRSEESNQVPMDWEPSSIDDSQNNDVSLRPQTFLPPPPFREETGIEELFQKKVKLVPVEDDPIKPTKWFKHLFSA